MIGSRTKANSKVRRSLCERRQEINTHRDISDSSKRRFAAQRSQSNDPPATYHTHEGHFAEGHPNGCPRPSCLKLQPGPGSNRDADARSRGGHGRTARCPRVQRMGGDLGRLRERPDPKSRTCFDHPCRTAPPFGEASCTSRPLTVAGVFPRHALNQNAFKNKDALLSRIPLTASATTTICREQPFSWPSTLPTWSPVTSW